MKVDIFNKTKKVACLLPIISIVLITVFLRFYKLEQTIVFSGELGHNYLAVKNFVEQGQISLLGPPTSHSWLLFGPLFYWLITPVLVENNKTGILVEKKDTNEMSKAIISLLLNKHMAVSFGKTARSKYLKEYTFDKVGGAYLKLFNKL